MSELGDALKGCIFARHGESIDTLAGVVSGWRDVPLTRRGQLQAEALGDGIRRHGLRNIVTSDLRRARETAAIVARSLGLPEPRIDARWRERGWGSREGKPHGDAAGATRIEPEETFRHRVLDALAEVGFRTLVLTHAGPLRLINEMMEGSGTAAPGVGEWISTGPPLRIPGATATRLRVIAHVFTPGRFFGTVVFVSDEADLARLSSDSVVFLDHCGKSAAFHALQQAGAAINLTRSLTQHLTQGRRDERPYAVAMAWPDGLPAEGELVDLELVPSAGGCGREVFDDVRLVATEATAIGGKAAGLHLLVEHGFTVPPFTVIPYDELARWERAADLADAAREWCTTYMPSMPAREARSWAVRSSADIEDAMDDPMSGSFESRLNVVADELPAAIKAVWQSATGSEIQTRIAQGQDMQPPRMAVIVQAMVEQPLFAGTIFVPAQDDLTTLLLEARLGETAEGLMDGCAHPDLVLRYDRCGRRVGDASTAAQIDPNILDELARGALRIYRSTGRGDIEFAVDGSGAIHWLQARTLNAALEIVDRRGFAPAAQAYYRLLAFAVPHANLVSPTWFRCFDLPDGRFGYSVGIRERDHLFHRRVADDPNHLVRVAQFGWKTEHAMQALLAHDHPDPLTLLDALVLHGAVQLPFSIPMDQTGVDRFQSLPIGTPLTSGLIEEFLHRIISKLEESRSVEALRRLLYTPRHTSATLESLERRWRLLCSGEDASALELLAALEPDLRDVPVIPDALQFCRTQLLRDLASDRNAALAKARALLDTMTAAFAERRRERTALIQRARERLSEKDLAVFLNWAQFLEMKAETNETHALYRGRCFRYFAESGFVPELDLVKSKIEFYLHKT